LLLTGAIFSAAARDATRFRKECADEGAQRIDDTYFGGVYGFRRQARIIQIARIIGKAFLNRVYSLIYVIFHRRIASFKKSE